LKLLEAKIITNSQGDVDKLVGFLKEKLNPAYRFNPHDKFVDITNLRDRNDAWKVVLWIKNNCGVQIRFTIIEKDEQGNLLYHSTCAICKHNTSKYPHHEHCK